MTPTAASTMCMVGIVAFSNTCAGLTFTATPHSWSGGQCFPPDRRRDVGLDPVTTQSGTAMGGVFRGKYRGQAGTGRRRRRLSNGGDWAVLWGARRGGASDEGEADIANMLKETGMKSLLGQMLKAAGQRQHWREAITLFDQMKAEGINPGKAAYTAALKACCKGAEWKRAVELFNSCIEDGFELDELMVSSAVKACCRAGRPLEAEALLVKGLSMGVEVEVGVYTAVMNACYTVGDLNAILSVAERIRTQNLRPDHNAYHLMVTSHIGKLDWVGATKTLVDMSKDGLAPSSMSVRQWRLASAAIEEIDLDVNEYDYDFES
ncbi:unnamed protein product [Choristocarpus tenellus]